MTADEVPERGKGRPMKVERPMDPVANARSDTPRCRECAVLGKGWCAVTARWRSGAEPMCNYGARLRRAAKVAARRAAR